jgi:hypothetical protein
MFPEASNIIHKNNFTLCICISNRHISIHCMSQNKTHAISSQIYIKEVMNWLVSRQQFFLLPGCFHSVACTIAVNVSKGPTPFTFSKLRV